MSPDGAGRGLDRWEGPSSWSPGMEISAEVFHSAPLGG